MLLTFRCSTSGEIRTHKQMLLRHSAIPIRVPRNLQVAYFLVLNWQFKGKYYADATFCDSDGARTHDPYIKSVVLYLLSYEVNYRLYFILGHILHKPNDKF